MTPTDKAAAELLEQLATGLRTGEVTVLKLEAVDAPDEASLRVQWAETAEQPELDPPPPSSPRPGGCPECGGTLLKGPVPVCSSCAWKGAPET